MGQDNSTIQSKFPLKYKITATFLEEEHIDISSFVAIRAPITKTASFAVLTVNIKAEYYMSLENSIRNNRFELVEVKFDIRYNHTTAEELYPPKIDDMGTKQYYAFHLEPYERVQPWSPYVITTMYLVNPVLYYLQVTNSFNKIIENKTPKDVLEQFEGFLTSTYGSKAFQWQKVGQDYELNKWKYEQILCRQNNDLMLPTHLINNYKLWHTYGYYFFDDFRFDNEVQSDITGWLVNLGDINQFQSRNIFEENRTEMFAANLFEDTKILADRLNCLYQEKPSLIVKGYDMQYGFRKATQNKDVVQMTSQTENPNYGYLVNDTKILNADAYTKSVQPTEQTIIYAPDDIEQGIKRFDKVSAQLRTQLHSIDTYYLHDAHVDFIQFGYKYNISPYEIDDYSWVPISICNIFIRDTGRVPLFVHNTRYQMFQFKQKKGAGGTLSGGNFRDVPV